MGYRSPGDVHGVSEFSPDEKPPGPPYRDARGRLSGGNPGNSGGKKGRSGRPRKGRSIKDAVRLFREIIRQHRGE